MPPRPSWRRTTKRPSEAPGDDAPIYLMSEDEVSEGLDQASALGIAYEAVEEPAKVEAVIARLDPGGPLWKLARYYEHSWIGDGERPRREREELELYDLDEDPTEAVNLAHRANASRECDFTDVVHDTFTSDGGFVVGEGTDGGVHEWVACKKKILGKLGLLSTIETEVIWPPPGSPTPPPPPDKSVFDRIAAELAAGAAVEVHITDPASGSSHAANVGQVVQRSGGGDMGLRIGDDRSPGSGSAEFTPRLPRFWRPDGSSYHYSSSGEKVEPSYRLKGVIVERKKKKS